MLKRLSLFSIFLALSTWTVAQAEILAVAAGPQAKAATGTNSLANVVAGPIPQKITSNAAEVWWAMDKPSGTMIRYGTDLNVMANRAKGSGKTSQEVRLTNLRPGTTYYVGVARADGTILQRGSFRTESANYKAQSQKVVITNGPVLEQVAPDNAIIAWSTNVPSSTIVHYGSDMNVMGHVAEERWGGTTHRVLVKNLQPNTRYWFKVESSQAKGTGSAAQSLPVQFKTQAPGEQVLSMPQPR